MYELLDQQRLMFGEAVYEGFPKLQAFMARFGGLPKVKAAYEATGGLPCNNKFAWTSVKKIC